MPIPLKLTGKIDIPLSDDMLMHYVMSRSNLALKGLVCALKGLKPEQIDSVILNNPIDYGSYAGKEIVLDIKVLLNGGEILDIELQTYYDAYWIERSLYYLSRSYDTLAAGEKYGMLKPITQVSIMNRDLFPTYPEFYSRFLLKNLRYDYPYTSNYALHVLYLNRIELATKQDAQDDLVFWAKLFSAATWEEIYALSRPDAVYEEVIDLMYNANIQPQEKTIFEAHHRYLLEYNSIKDRMSEMKAQLNDDAVQLNTLSTQLDDANALLAKYRQRYGILPDEAQTP